MMSPVEAVIMKHVGAPALGAAFAAILLSGMSLIGAAFLGFGLQAELSRWISEGLAFIIVGIVLITVPLIIIAARIRSVRTGHDVSESVQSKTETDKIFLTSNLSQLARTALIGLSARRPLATLAMAAALGAVVLIMSDADKGARPVYGPKPA